MDYKPAGFHTLTANATYKNTKAAIEFYIQALNLKVGTVLEAPNGVVMHADATIGDSKFFMNDEFEGSPRKAPTGNAAVAFYLYVPDVDQAYALAVEAGMTSSMEPQDMFWGDRMAVASDPFGYTWNLVTLVKAVTPAEMEAGFAEMMKAMGS
jgi:PhnB protein